MGFFDNLFSSQQSSTSTPSTTDVQIEVNAERVLIPGDAAKGKTIAQLFTEFSEALGTDPTRIQRFVDAGQIVAGDQVVEPGHTYRGTVTTETKQAQ